MKTKEQVAEEIKTLLEENSMKMITVKRFMDYEEDPRLDVHLILKSDEYKYRHERESIPICYD